MDVRFVQRALSDGQVKNNQKNPKQKQTGKGLIGFVDDIAKDASGHLARAANERDATLVKSLLDPLTVEGPQSYVRALAWQMHVEQSMRNAALAWASIRDPGGAKLSGVLDSANAFSEAGRGVGRLAGPLGGIIGSIGGAVLGAIAGFVPQAREAMLTRFRTAIAQLTPFERYCAIAQGRSYALAAMAKDGVSIGEQFKVREFRTGDDPPLGHNSATGGATSFVVLCFESLQRTTFIDSAWFGESEKENDALLLWFLCVTAAFHDDSKRVDRWRWAWLERNVFVSPVQVNGFSDSAVVKPWRGGVDKGKPLATQIYSRVNGKTAGDLRKLLDSYGLTLWNPPRTKNMVNLELR